MIENYKDYKKLFQEISKLVKIKLGMYVIGGAVLLYRDLKPATKDIDIVVRSIKEFDELYRVLKEMDFKPMSKNAGYEHLNISSILIRGDLQIDLFCEKVCSKFSFSKEMAKRSEEILLLGKVKVYLCSNEDVFAFKTMTDRAGDTDDCIALAKRGLDWAVILKEIKYQVGHSGKDVWITWINERLELLEQTGVIIPIIKETQELTREYYKDLEKQYT